MIDSVSDTVNKIMRYKQTMSVISNRITMIQKMNYNK